MYKNPVSGAIPSAANQLECVTNKAVAQCYGISLDIKKMVLDNAAIQDNMYLIYNTDLSKPFLNKPSHFFLVFEKLCMVKVIDGDDATK